MFKLNEYILSVLLTIIFFILLGIAMYSWNIDMQLKREALKALRKTHELPTVVNTHKTTVGVNKD
jgi:hypothetical protein